MQPKARTIKHETVANKGTDRYQGIYNKNFLHKMLL